MAHSLHHSITSTREPRRWTRVSPRSAAFAMNRHPRSVFPIPGLECHSDGRKGVAGCGDISSEGRAPAGERAPISPALAARSLSPRNKPLEGGGPPRRERRTGAEQGSHVHCGYLAPFYELTHRLTTFVRAPAARTAAAACRSSAH